MEERLLIFIFFISLIGAYLTLNKSFIFHQLQISSSALIHFKVCKAPKAEMQTIIKDYLLIKNKSSKYIKGENFH